MKLHDAENAKRVRKLNTISRRDLFAAAALAGIMANPSYFRLPKVMREGTPTEIAKRCADRMIEILNEKGIT